MACYPGAEVPPGSGTAGSAQASGGGMADDAARVRQLESALRQALDEIDALRQREAALAVELKRRDASLAASQQQHASGEILDVIAGSRADLQTVLQTMGERAARLCDAPSVFIHLVKD